MRLRTHQHALEAVAVEQHAPRTVMLPVPIPYGATVVLFHCTACPHVETTRLEGRWTLDQVLGQRGLTATGKIETELLAGEATSGR